MCEAGVHVKAIQDTLGQNDISSALNIYADVTKALRRAEFEGLDAYFKNAYNKTGIFDAVLLLPTKRDVHQIQWGGK